MRKYSVPCATLGSIGYAPAGGSWASFLALPLVVVLQVLCGWQLLYTLVVCLFGGVSCWIVYNALPSFRQRDPKMIVLDEVVGMCVTFVGIAVTPKILMMGFLLFRFFDISKWCGVSLVERLPHAWGVVLDDVVAGFLSSICLRLLINYVII